MEWTRGPSIGRGASATVSIATTTSGELFAVKSAELSRSSCLQREQHFLSQLSSPNIIKYRGFEITRENSTPIFNLFMEYVAGGTISDEITRQGGSMNESTIQIFTNQILQGLNYLHVNGFVHCDIKSENLLIGEDCIKIADLGCARLAKDGATAFSGTPAFMSPEVARGEEQGISADVWALGCTIIEMATGSSPWLEMSDPVSALYRIGFSGDSPEIPRWLSEKARDFVTKCLIKDPRGRWTAKDLLQHPFMADLELNSKEVDEFSEDSPTGVLDRGFWDSVEACEGHRNLTHTSSSSDSLAKRIKCLIEFSSSSGSDFPNWTWDEDWVTVRSNDIEENCEIDKELIDTGLCVFSGDDLEEHGDLIVGEDFLFECFVDPVFRMSRSKVIAGFEK
ncbi:Mitogen-activated protein kinase kinase [Actinidia chinensis var. chinensis]|uniref:Mitogen-activated protein kinase kinase n=1 Tax=Actinidia chinensis var. chinensis TaxID=1590841 RepID=A0A2R6PRH5_ACTCC|nr:Mitogen-activated protein kinase kinase [Actinidia chinensis var. chinensis]